MEMDARIEVNPIDCGSRHSFWIHFASLLRYKHRQSSTVTSGHYDKCSTSDLASSSLDSVNRSRMWRLKLPIVPSFVALAT